MRGDSRRRLNEYFGERNRIRSGRLFGRSWFRNKRMHGGDDRLRSRLLQRTGTNRGKFEERRELRSRRWWRRILRLPEKLGQWEFFGFDGRLRRGIERRSRRGLDFRLWQDPS